MIELSTFGEELTRDARADFFLEEMHKLASDYGFIVELIDFVDEKEDAKE